MVIHFRKASKVCSDSIAIVLGKIQSSCSGRHPISSSCCGQDTATGDIVIVKARNIYGIPIVLFQSDLHFPRIVSVITGCPFGHIVIISHGAGLNMVNGFFQLGFRSGPIVYNIIFIPIGIRQSRNIEACATISSTTRLTANINTASIGAIIVGTANTNGVEVDILCRGNLDVTAAGKFNIIPCHKIQGVVGRRDILDIRAINLGLPAGVNSIGYGQKFVFRRSSTADIRRVGDVPSRIGQARCIRSCICFLGGVFAIFIL